MAKLILLHGALASSAQFHSLLPLLDPSLQAVAIDLGGHGNKAASHSSFTLQRFCEELLQYMQQNPEESYNLMGYSMGGYIAMYLALLHPARVNKVMTLSTKYHWTKEQADAESKRLAPDMLESKAPDFIKSLETAHPANEWRELLLQTASFMQELGEHKYLEPEKAVGIQQPVLISLGDRDKMVSLDESIATYKALAKGQLQVFPNTPHLFEKMNMQLLAFGLNKFFTNTC